MTTTTYISRQQMDALADAHFRAEQDGDIVAIIEGFAEYAEHDVARSPMPPARRLQDPLLDRSSSLKHPGRRGYAPTETPAFASRASPRRTRPSRRDHERDGYRCA